MQRTIQLLLIILFVMYYHAGYAQRQYSIGVNSGFTHYYGDVCSVFDIENVRYTAGVTLTDKISDHMRIRGSFQYSRICGQDSLASCSKFQNQRGLDFFTDIYAIEAVAKFNFNDEYYTFHGRGILEHLSPYVFSGMNVFYFVPQTIYNNKVYDLQKYHTSGTSYSQISAGMIFGVGVEYCFARQFSIGVEGQVCYTFTNYLDDIKPFSNYPSMSYFGDNKEAYSLAYRNSAAGSPPFETKKSRWRRGSELAVTDIFASATFHFNYYLGR